jgi:uncharacterized protein (TIRG00374 family)
MIDASAGTLTGERSGRPRRRFGWLRLLVPAALVVALVLWVDLGAVARDIAGLPLPLMLLALGLALVDRIVMGLKWRQLVRATGTPLSASDGIRIQYQAAAGGRAIPTALGSDVIRLILAARAGVTHGVILASIAVEKAVALLVSVAFAGAALLYLPGRLAGADAVRVPGFVVAGALLLAAGALILMLAAPAHEAGRRLLDRIAAGRALPPRLVRVLGRLSAALLGYRQRPGAVLLNAVMAAGEYMLQLGKLYVIARALDIDMALLPFAAVTALALFVRRIAGTVDGWGLGEGAAVLTFAAFGVAAETAVALFVANFAVTTVAVLPGLLFFLSHPVTRPAEPPA